LTVAAPCAILYESEGVARATKLGKKMNTNNLENMIRDKLTDDDLISGLIEQD